MVVGTAAIVWGAETFAEHLADASKRLGVTAFALALLLAGAEPEELATVVTASARGVDGVAFGDVIGANAAIVTIALGTGAFITVLPFGRTIGRYALGGLATGVLAAALIWDGNVTRPEGIVLVAAYVVFVATIWLLERRPPSLGEAGELDEAIDPTGRVGRDLGYVLVGLVALTSDRSPSSKASADSPTSKRPRPGSGSRSSGSPPHSNSSSWRTRPVVTASPKPSSPA